MGDTVNLPAGAPAGADWSQTLQNIVAYGASRMFDAKAVEKIYKASPTNFLMDEDGTLYPAGQKAPSAYPNPLMTIPPVVWLLGAGLVVYLVVKD